MQNPIEWVAEGLRSLGAVFIGQVREGDTLIEHWFVGRNRTMVIRWPGREKNLEVARVAAEALAVGIKLCATSKGGNA
ncbi:hypothetical protein HY632_00310 [Candidatus Uhrbacteria bacterium]|nr:hypothetical protein [Candidatus Uhrbacteria bacterium]